MMCSPALDFVLVCLRPAQSTKFQHVHATCNMFLVVFSPVITVLSVVSPTGLFQLRGVYCCRCIAAPVNSLLQGKEVNKIDSYLSSMANVHMC